MARFGGEEFFFLLPKADFEDGKLAVEKLRGSVMAENFPNRDAAHPHGALTISLGVAEYPGDSQDDYELLDLADRALYLARNIGQTGSSPDVTCTGCRVLLNKTTPAPGTVRGLSYSAQVAGLSDQHWYVSPANARLI